MRKFCNGLLKDELNSVKQKEPTECDMEVVYCKIADTDDEATNLVDGLR